MSRYFRLCCEAILLTNMALLVITSVSVALDNDDDDDDDDNGIRDKELYTKG